MYIYTKYTDDDAVRYDIYCYYNIVPNAFTGTAEDAIARAK